jgi:hypothetical protein
MSAVMARHLVRLGKAVEHRLVFPAVNRLADAP